jgi:hypothetical protein
MRSMLVWLMVLSGGVLAAANPATRRQSHFRGALTFAALYSHSMVPGGLLVMSSTTRLTSDTSLVMRVEMRSSTS